ncbi:uncharacterized protein LY89DRAFT_614876 [Mollisia scopiformis]|uniref:Genetic interactor of prohibitins 3, mitochondrial n=1 Tax=Mollisia scopiformis TaxID=149040 RepID=A0A194XDM0_MOLSC|nr:uncharacterized protein LY89DRAFT_614876 [Mollisia scopiformis]KUJ18246.1 hypothetical protein LY89DRAFT_614876 [Mollisia scopiformis]
MSKTVRLAAKLVKQVGTPVAELPAFLCPGLLRTAQSKILQSHSKSLGSPLISQRRCIASITHTSTQASAADSRIALRRLPQQCIGCGALSQTVNETGAGFYTLSRKSVKRYLEVSSDHKDSAEDQIVRAALSRADVSSPEINLGGFVKPESTIEPPVCDRCHQIRHHDTGVSIHHPSAESIQDTIFESPYKYNHVYHVLDAADFPMSLVPGLHKLLHLTPLRSRNRRSKTGRFYHGRKTEVSFVITRSDLLAPQKTQVDSMMPYLRAVLRDALGRNAKDVRLGNVSCVSAKQAWWTKELKAEIWKRGGGGWIVGKVNVGKSQLFHNIFPKGRRERDKLLGKKFAPPIFTEAFDEIQEINKAPATSRDHGQELVATSGDEVLDVRDEYRSTEADSLDTSSLLPPVPAEVDYPAMPLVSALPGTTASPIRLSFGNGKGELIDLPGLSRGDLEHHVQPEHRAELVMRSRIRPEQKVIKAGQSLLLGGFIRITPTTPDVIILAYAFTPIHPHLTATEKAINTQMHNGSPNVTNISLPETAEKIKSAGTFHLKWDVTKQRAGPVTRPEAAGIKPERLPYMVLATDILIEGCGWVELVAQVRKRPGEVEPREKEEDKWESEASQWNQDPDPSWPAVEVFTPNGKFVSSRRPMNAWLNIAQKPGEARMKGRPRRSMKGVKKVEKKRGHTATL